VLIHCIASYTADERSYRRTDKRRGGIVADHLTCYGTKTGTDGGALLGIIAFRSAGNDEESCRHHQ
jgi:hypothetical protein